MGRYGAWVFREVTPSPGCSELRFQALLGTALGYRHQIKGHASSQIPIIGRPPGIAVKTRFILETFPALLSGWHLPGGISANPAACNQAGHDSEQSNFYWPGGRERLIMLGLKVEQQAPALGKAGATAGSILVLTLINAAGRNRGAWVDNTMLCLMLPWLKFHQVLMAARAHKAQLRSFLCKGRSASLEDHGDRIIYCSWLSLYLYASIHGYHYVETWISSILLLSHKMIRLGGTSF